MYLKIHETKDGRIVAVCDDGLLGKIFQEGKAVLDLKTYINFYNGEKGKNSTIKKALQSFSSANLVGRESTAMAINLGLISKEDVRYIQGIPYVQIYRI